jgi:hypothetical protein
MFSGARTGQPADHPVIEYRGSCRPVEASDHDAPPPSAVALSSTARIVRLDVERPRPPGPVCADAAVQPKATAGVDLRVIAAGQAGHSPAEQLSIERHQRPVICRADLEMHYCLSHRAGSFVGKSQYQHYRRSRGVAWSNGVTSHVPVDLQRAGARARFVIMAWLGDAASGADFVRS